MSNEEQRAVDIMSQKIPTKEPSRGPQESPLKRRKAGITLAQKQALIDNLQLEIAERARKLRANYNIHAQSLRTRIEIRVNRIPLSLRKLNMGDLLQKYSAEQQQQQQQQQQPPPNTAASTIKGPPVPAKDPLSSRPLSQRAAAPVAPPSARPAKRPSHEISGGDKENDIENIENPKKKARSIAATDIARNPAQILSPTTSNSRVAPRDRTVATPGRPNMARPAVTPGRAAMATTILNNMVEKARATRAAPAPRKTTTSTTASSADGGAGTAAARRKRGATVTAAVAQPPSRPATRTARRASGNSESSDASTSTVVRKRPATAPPGAVPKLPAPPPATSKRTVMGTIKKGVVAGTTRKAPASRTTAGAAASASTSSTGRVLRKRP